MQSTAFFFRCFIGPRLLSDHRVNRESNQGRSAIDFYGKLQERV